MSARRIFIPIVMVLALVVQFVPGTMFGPAPAAAATTRCNGAEFVTDVTVPDGTVYAPGATFAKTWRLKNIGTCTWTTSYAAVFVSGSQMSGASPVYLTSSVDPGETVDVTVNMTAPTAPGSYTGYWKLRDASGVQFGLGTEANGIFLVRITVSGSYTAGFDFVANYCSAVWSSGSGTLPCPGTSGSAYGSVTKVDSPQLENGSIDSSAALLVNPQQVSGGYIKGVYPAYPVQAGDRFQSIINCAYNAPYCYVNFRLNYKIGSGAEQTLWSFNERYEGLYYRADVSLNSLAGQSVQFILYVADVSGYGTPSADRAMWGGAKIVRLGGSVPPPPSPAPSTCDRGAFVTDVTIPDGSTLTPGAAFTKTWRITNVGSCTWTTSYALVYVFGDTLGAASVVNLPSSVAPGQTADFSVNMVAPSVAGHYRSYWRFRNASGAQFGVGSGMITFYADINVSGSGSPGATSYDFTANVCSATWSSGAGTLPCTGTDGDSRGFVLSLASPTLENGVTGAAGLLTAPQNVTDGYIQGVYPALAIHSGDHFQSVINCQYGATSCYVGFQLNYQIGSGPVYNLRTFHEKLDGLYYNLDVDLSSLAGQNVKLILKVIADGSPYNDRAVWSGPHIGYGSTTYYPTAAPSSTVSVYFQDSNRYAAGTEPYEVAVSRPASTIQSDPMTALTQLFLGPSSAEYASGLRVVLSGTTGFSQFVMDDNVAEVYLLGNCSSGGATYTIANLISANLKQFAGIDYVKIYDEVGDTEHPSGESDSIPECLEP